jgi:hypothetical protein
MEPAPSGTDPLLCAYSGRMFPASQMVRIGEHWIAEEHKDECVQFLQQGGSLPRMMNGAHPAAPPRLAAALGDAFPLLWRALPAMLFVQALVWIPCNLIYSYMSYEVLGEEDFAGSFKLSSALQLWFGIIADAGCIHALGVVASGGRAGLAATLGAGLRHWPRMWLMTLLSGIAMVVGLILLIIPGLMLMVRFHFAACFIVAEKCSSAAALQRSYDMSKGRFWQLTVLLLLTIGLLVVPALGWGVLWPFMPEEWDRWQIDALITWFIELPGLYAAAATYTYWDMLRKFTPRPV